MLLIEGQAHAYVFPSPGNFQEFFSFTQLTLILVVFESS